MADDTTERELRESTADELRAEAKDAGVGSWDELGAVPDGGHLRTGRRRRR